MAEIRFGRRLQGFNGSVTNNVSAQYYPIAGNRSHFVLLVLQTLMDRRRIRVGSFREFRRHVHHPPCYFGVVARYNHLGVLVVVQVGRVRNEIIIDLNGMARR